MQREIAEMDSKANLLIGMNSNDEEWMLNYTKLVQTIPNYSSVGKPKENRLIKENFYLQEQSMDMRLIFTV